MREETSPIFASIKERVRSNINRFESRVRFDDLRIVEDEYNIVEDGTIIVEVLYDVIAFGNNSNITETSNISDGVRLTIGN